ncbi:MAG: hypothetical protein JNJ54_05225 [Myxococcaceae bacterium]|nr:hypothetical protein [Myxococcaceae bacterium]
MSTLGELLRAIDGFHWESSLYLEPDVKLTAAVKAQVVRTDPYSLEPLEDVPPQYRRLLSVQDVQGIVSNARQQLGKPTTAQLVEALQYYVTKDAYLEFPQPKRGGETAAVRRSRS